METIDWKKVAQTLEPDANRLSYQENKHLFTKVAFDVFQLNSSPSESYWILETAEDGSEYLVATYDAGKSEQGMEARGSWEAVSDKLAENVTLFYRGMPIKRFAASKYSFDKQDVNIFKNTLVQKLNKDASFVGKLLKDIPKEKKNALTQAFPELGNL